MQTKLYWVYIISIHIVVLPFPNLDKNQYDNEYDCCYFIKVIVNLIKYNFIHFTFKKYFDTGKKYDPDLRFLRFIHVLK